ncbi:MAG: hypothetical protein V3S55_10030 [Nitrospiraceae bacterium]
MTATRWYPHRETVRSISPKAIAPNEWGFYGPKGSGMVNVPIWHQYGTAAYYINRYRPLHGYSGQAAGRFKT